MRGITPVVAVVLLLLVTISIVGFAMVFFQRTAESAAAAGETQMSQVSAMGENFDIVSIDGNKVYVRNLGSGTLTNVGFYVDGAAVQNITSASIPPGTMAEVQLSTSQLAMAPGDKLRVTSAGHQAEQDANFYEKSTAAYWRFDEADGRTIKDYSGNGNDGTFSGESWNDGTVNGATQAEGKYGNALGFDGVNDYVDVGRANSLLITGDLSLEVWIKPAAYTSPNSLIISQSDANGYTGVYGLLLDSSGTLALYRGNGVSAQASVWTTTILPLNVWTHLAVTVSGVTVKFYLNGVLDKTGDHGAVTVADAGTNILMAGSSRYNGSMDEVRIYNRALTQQEIIEDMNSAYPIGRTVASYSFEKIEGDKALDTHNVVKGRYGAALSFDGGGDFVNITDSDSWNFGGGNFTIGAWVNYRVAAGDKVFVAQWGDAGDNGAFAFMADSTRMYFFWSTTGSNENNANVAWSRSANTWYYVTVVRSGTSLKMYADGIETYSGSISGALYNSSRNLNIGAYKDGGQLFNGVIDEVRILNTAV